MLFGEAIEAMKAGKRVAREGWNGKGMYLFIVGDWQIGTTAIEPTLAETNYTRREFIVMKTADNQLVPWSASQSDVLADDYVSVDLLD